MKTLRREKKSANGEGQIKNCWKRQVQEFAGRERKEVQWYMKKIVSNRRLIIGLLYCQKVYRREIKTTFGRKVWLTLQLPFLFTHYYQTFKVFINSFLMKKRHLNHNSDFHEVFIVIKIVHFPLKYPIYT